MTINFFNMQSLAGFINVILREIQDNLPSLLDSALRMLLQLLAHWKTAVSAGPRDKVRQRPKSIITFINNLVFYANLEF